MRDIPEDGLDRAARMLRREMIERGYLPPSPSEEPTDENRAMAARVIRAWLKTARDDLAMTAKSCPPKRRRVREENNR